MIAKIRTSYRAFLKGFVGLFLTFQCVLGILYWCGNVTRSQQFDTASDLGNLIADMPVLPVHLVQTGLVFAAAYYLFRRFRERKQSLMGALAALTIPFVMQVCLCETEHAAALAALLCMTAVTLDCHTHKERKTSRPQTVLFCACLVTLLFCGAAYSCAGAWLCGLCMIIEEKKYHRKKSIHILCLSVALFACVVAAWFGSHLQNEANPDRMQITFESVLFKRFAHPGFDQKLVDGMPQEVQELYTAADIEKFRLHPYLLDTTFASELTKTAGEERTREIYLELAWYGFLYGTKTDIFMMLEDTLCYLTPQLMYPFYSDGTILAEFGWSYQQFVSGQTQLAWLYLYGSLLGYAVSLVLTLLYGFLSGIADHFHGVFAALKRYWPIFPLWLGLSVIFMMRGAAIFNYKYAAFQAILGYLPMLHVSLQEPEDTGVKTHIIMEKSENDDGTERAKA